MTLSATWSPCPDIDINVNTIDPFFFAVVVPFKAMDSSAMIQ